MDLNTAANEFANTLINTQEFSELRASKNEMGKNPAYAKMLEDFRRKQEMLYNQNQTLSQNQTQALMEQIESDYRKLSGIPDISRYFKVSDRFNELMNRTMNAVTVYIDRYLQ